MGRVRLADSVPEDWLKGGGYADRGCSLHPSCLTCPLPRCRYELAPLQARRALRELQLVELLPEVGVTPGERLPFAVADELAVLLGCSRRTVYRLVAGLAGGGVVS